MKNELLSREEEFFLLNINGLGSLYCEDIYALDLHPVKQKLQDPSGKRPWSKHKCESTELAYKRFLTLKRMFPGKLLSPSPSIHEFWRQHYLDKEKYANDCHQVFGYYMGKLLWQQKHLRESEEHLEQASKYTLHLYKTYFREQGPGQGSN
ncbi:MAG: hypothetical protein JNK73_06390 [Bacteroidia bacterium]|nr:hypothetical protein [Bacteroidia bacterium]